MTTPSQRNTCIYNEAIECSYVNHGTGQCDHCGWNPEVAKARLVAITQELREKYTEK